MHCFLYDEYVKQNLVCSHVPRLGSPLAPSKSGLSLTDHFGQSQRQSLIRRTLGVKNEERNNLGRALKFLDRGVVLIWGLTGGILWNIHPAELVDK